MDRVVTLKRAELQGITATDGADPGATVDQAVASWDSGQRRTLLVDLAFSDPFAPYSLKFSNEELITGLRPLAERLEEPASVVDEIVAARMSALRSQRRRNWGRVGAIGVLTAAIIGTAGWALAPVLGTAIGTSAGLTGAAATAHGLALLGGGTLAAGGAGMAGGMWLVASAGAAVGLVSGAGSTLLYQLGAAEVRSELIKLQVTFRVAVLRTQGDLARAATMTEGLRATLGEMQDALATERALNDENSERVKTLEEKIEAISRSIEWMDEQRAAVRDEPAPV